MDDAVRTERANPPANPARDNPEPPPAAAREKRPYTQPKITEYGDVRELTRAAGSGKARPTTPKRPV